MAWSDPFRTVFQRKDGTSRFIWAERQSDETRYVSQDRIPYPARPASGVRITPDTAVTVSTVWACIRYISQTISICPWQVMVGTDGVDAVRSSTHPIDKLLSGRPSPEYSSFQFRELLLHWALRWGNGYAEIERMTNSLYSLPIALHPIHPDRVVLMRDTNTRQVFYRVYNGTNGTTDLDPADMYHLRGFGEGPVGVNVMHYAAESIGWARAAQLFGAAFFGDGMNVTGVVKVKHTMKPKGMQRLRASLDSLYRGLHGSKYAILDDTMDFTPVSIDPDKAQFVATNQFLVSEVCFVPGTQIHTPTGPCTIEKIKEGDLVLTHKGRWRPVKKVMSRDYVGTVITTRAKGLEPITSTPNHPYYIQMVRKGGGLPMRPDGEPIWQNAEDLVVRNMSRRHDAALFSSLIVPRLSTEELTEIDLSAWIGGISLPIVTDTTVGSNQGTGGPINRRIKMDYDFGWVCGFYAANGSSTDHQSTFTMSGDKIDAEKDLSSKLSSVFGVFTSTTSSKTENMNTVRVSSKLLAQFFADFYAPAPDERETLHGKLSHRKRFPAWCMNSNKDFRKGLIAGVTAGDGCVSSIQSKGIEEQELNRQAFGGASHALVSQVRLLLWAEGIGTSFRQTADYGRWEINGRSGISRPRWGLEWHPNETGRRGMTGVAEDFVYFTLNGADKSTYSGTVYNLEVEEDESYTTVGGCVHNCRWFGVPPHKVASLDRATFNNIESQSIEVIGDTIVPWVTRLEQEADYKLFGANRPGYYTHINLIRLLRGDSAARAGYYQTMRNIGVFSVNDILQQEQMNSISKAEGGDVRVMQAQWVPLEMIAKGGAISPVQPAQPAPSPSEAAAMNALKDMEFLDAVR